MKKQEVEFKVGKDSLRGTLFIPSGKGPFPAVIFFHGRGGSRTNYLAMARSLSQRNIITLAFDFRGCGKSDGKLENQTHQMGIEDGMAGLNFLLRQSVDKDRIGIQGSSFGGYVAVMLLDKYRLINSLVLRVPAAYSDSFLNSTISASEEKDFFGNEKNWTNSSSYKKIREFKGKLLVIQSEKDELISEIAIRRYYDLASKTIRKTYFIQNQARHSIHDNPKARKEFNLLTVNWFLETL
jgi:dipeptidyl aminopeptidase/acylaminoacyl peptidase